MTNPERTAGRPWLSPECILARLWNRTDVRGPDDCWFWRGAKGGENYGDIRIDGKNRRVHIVVHELLIGPIPQGLQVDHVCHNEAAWRGECAGGASCPHRRCCNPAHLEAVTRSENCKRGRNGRYLAERTHCINGHEYTEANTIIDKRGYRHCRECKRIESRAYMRRKRAEARADA